MADLSFDDLIPQSRGSAGLSFDDLIPSVPPPKDVPGDMAAGQLERGNLDAFNRPVLKNPDGSYSTTSSISVGTDKGEVVIPTVVDGKRLSNDEAIDHFRKTGQHFGVFDNSENADIFAQDLHERQAEAISLQQPELGKTQQPNYLAEGTDPGAPVFGEPPKPDQKSDTTLPDATKPEASWASLGKSWFDTTSAWARETAGGAMRAVGEVDPSYMARQSATLQNINRQHGGELEAAPGFPDLAKRGQELYKAADDDMKAAQPNVPYHGAKDWVFKGANVLTQMIPMVAASLVTRGEGAGLATMGAQVYGQQYGSAREEGQSPESAAGEARFYGLAETLTEILPLGSIIKAGKGGFPQFVKSMGFEAFGEGVNQAVEQAWESRKMMAKDGITFKEAWDKQGGWDSVWEASTLGAGAGGVIHAGAHVVQKATEPSVEKQIHDEVAGSQFTPAGAVGEAVAALDPNRATSDAELRSLHQQLPRAPLTAEEQAGPLPKDILSEGKALIDAVAGGQPLPEMPTAQPMAPPVQPTGPLVQPPPTDLGAPEALQSAVVPPATGGPEAPQLQDVPTQEAATPPPAPAPAAPVAPLVRANGQPFKTEAEARLASNSRKDLKGKGYRATQVDGGWGLALASATPETGGAVRAAPAIAPVAGPSSPAAGEPTAVAAPESLISSAESPVIGQEAPSSPPFAQPEGPGTRTAPVDVTEPEHLEATSEKVNPAPSDAMKAAGNYAKAHIKLHGLDIAIENPRGSQRTGTDAGGKPWSVTMPAAYGYIKRTEGADGDHVDVYVGPNPTSDNVFIVDQVDHKTKKWDEHKVLLGFQNEADAIRAYDAAFSDGKGRHRRKDVTLVSVDDFKAWLKSGDTTMPFAAAATQADAKAPPPAAVSADDHTEASPKPDARTSAEIDGIHQAARAAGVPSDNAPAFMARTKELTGKEHLDDMSLSDIAKVHAELASNPHAFGAKPRALAEEFGLTPSAGLQDLVAAVDAENQAAEELRAAEVEAVEAEIKDREKENPQPSAAGHEAISGSGTPSDAGGDRPIAPAEGAQGSADVGEGGTPDAGRGGQAADSVEPAAPAKGKSPAPKSAAPQPGKVEDVGENLKFNRRNFSGGGLSWEQLLGMTPALRTRETVKSKVWPKPDYQALIDGGMPAIAARAVKQVYDAIGATPAKTDDATMKLYVDTLAKVRDGLFSWANEPARLKAWSDAAREMANRMSGSRVSLIDIARAGDKTETNSLLNAIWPAETDKTSMERWKPGTPAGDEIRAIGGNRTLKSMQIGISDLLDFQKEISEKGWPTPQEAWQRQGLAIVDVAKEARVAEGSIRRQDSFEKTFRILLGSKYSAPIWPGTFATREQAEQTKAGLGNIFALTKGSKILGDYPTQAAAQEAARAAVKRGGAAGTGDVRGMNLTASTRTGPARRTDGRDVTPQDLVDTFGFRGVNFGREGWMNQAERQVAINAAYDSLHDLAEIMGVPPKALSLNGDLGIAFGAQGRGGSAAAHFVPGLNEINLTKTSGAGTLAHEWGHALDHYFAVQAGLERKSSPFMSENPGGAGEAGTVRPEIRQAFDDVVKAMKKRPMTPEEIAGARQANITRATKNLKSWMKSIRSDLEKTPDALPFFDKLADRLRAGDMGEGLRLSGKLPLQEVVAQMREMVKTHRGKASSVDITDNWKGLDNAARHMAFVLKEDQAAKNHIPQTSTDYLKESAARDKGKSGNAYWATPREMFARAFELWAADHLAAVAQSNTFLTDAAIRERMKNPEGGNAFPYPRGFDRETINTAIGKLVDAIETKETDKGTAMFALRRAQPRSLGIPTGAGVITSFKSDAEMKAHPDYKAAKAGDPAAAARVVDALVTDDKLQQAQQDFGPDAVYVPVIAQEMTGVNQLPTQLAELYATATGATTTDQIQQVSKAWHTGARPLERIISRPVFDGPVEPGKRYVLVDDATVLGGTLAELANHIRAGGGEVAGLVTLVNASRSGVYTPKKLHVQAIEARFGDEIRKHGIEPSALTADEATYLLGYRDADGLRAGIAKAKSERGQRLRSKGLRAPEADGEGQLRLADPTADFSAAVSPTLRDDLTAALRQVDPRGRITLRLVPKIEAWVNGQLSKADGQYLGHLIEVALDAPDKGWVLNHEAIHGLRDLGVIRPDEWSALVKAAQGNAARMANIREAYGEAYRERFPKDHEDKILEEAVADMFADWQNGELDAHGFQRSGMERIRAFFRALADWLRGKGFNSVESVFGRISEGKVGARDTAADAESATGEASRYALKQPAAPAFYSALTRGVEAIKQPKAPAEQWAGIIDKLAGVKREEIDWSGVKDWLAEQKGSVTKDQLTDYLRANEVQVQEITKGAKNTAGILPESVGLAEVRTEDDGQTTVYQWGHGAEEFRVFEHQDGEWWATDIGSDESILPGGQIEATTKTGAIAALQDALVGELASRRELEETGQIDANRNTRFSSYTLPGGENYRELLLTVPTAPPNWSHLGRGNWSLQGGGHIERLINGKYRLDQGSGINSLHDTLEDAKSEAEKSNLYKGDPNAFRASHFTEPNIVAHVRFDDRTDTDGKRVLFLEEIQSDWAQKGRRHGFKGGPDERAAKAAHAKILADIAEAQTAVDQAKDKNRAAQAELEHFRAKEHEALRRMIDAVGGEPGAHEAAQADVEAARPEHRKAMEREHATWSDVIAAQGALHRVQLTEIPARPTPKYSAVPSGPFVENTEAWASLAFRRMLRWAAEKGYDRVAWTTGEQQADRYSLSKHISKIELTRSGVSGFDSLERIENRHPEGGGRLKAWDKSGHEVIDRSVDAKDLPDIIGKEAAERLTKATPTERNISGTTNSVRSLEGMDLKVGGEGMVGFYDKILPSIANKLGKKWGAKVGETQVPLYEDPNMDNDSGWESTDNRATRGEGDEVASNGEGWGIRRPDGSIYGHWDRKQDARTWLESTPIGGAGGPATVHSIDVTPAMRESVMQGQPLFSLRRGTVRQERAINKAIAPRDGTTIGQRIAKSYGEIKGKLADEFTWAVADEFHGLRKMGKTLMPKAADRELGSYVGARLARHAAGQIEAFLRWGAPVWNDENAVLEQDGQGGLYQIIGPVYRNGMERLFDGYAYARRVRTQGLIADEREKNLTEPEVDELLALGTEHPEIAEAFDKIQAYKKKVLDAVEGMGLINAEQRATWEKADHVPFYRATGEDKSKPAGPGRKAGLANQSAGIRRLTGAGETHVVINDATGEVAARFETPAEAKAEQKRLGAGYSVEAAGEPIVGVVENIARNITHLLDAAMKNHAAVMAIDEALELGWAEKAPMAMGQALVPVGLMAKELRAQGVDVGNGAEGIAAVMAIMPPVKPGNDIVAVRRDGKTEYYRVEDKLVYRSLAGLYRTQMSSFIRPLAAIKNLLTRTVTAMPGFMVRNFVRDSAASWLISEERGLNFYGEMAKSVKALATRMDDPKTRALMAAGGDTGFYQNAPADVVKQLRRMEAQGQASLLRWANPKELFHGYEKLGRASELANRRVTFESEMKRSDNARQAAFSAADLLDFQLKGGSDFIQGLTAVVPFLNARIQGLYKLGRAGLSKSPEERKSFAAKATMMIAFSLALMALNAGDDDDNGYNDLPEWVKDGSWVVNNYRLFGKDTAKSVGLPRFFLIPKPFELGVLFGTMPERIVQLVAGNDRAKDTWKSVYTALLSTFEFNPLGNPVTKEIMEQWANKDLFTGMPLVSQAVERLPPDQQYNAGTSETAKWLGGKLNMSPARIEHAVRGFTGTLGSYALAAADATGRALGITPPKPAQRVDQMEIIRSFIASDPAIGTKWLERFYELTSKAGEVYAGARARAKEGDAQGAHDTAMAHRGLLAVRKPLNRTAQTLSDIRKEMKQIGHSLKMSPEEKRSRMDALLMRQNALAKLAAKAGERAAGE